MRKVFKNTANQTQFENEGYIIVDMMSQEDVQQLVNLFGEIESSLVQMPFATSTMAMDTDIKCEVSDALKKALAKRIDEVFEDYKWFFGSFIYKYPSTGGTQGEVSMHQDASLLDERKFHGINIFCSLTDSNETAGTLQIIPKSHLLNDHPRGFGQPFPYTEYNNVLSPKLKRIDLKPGQAIIYTTKLFHYSKPNLSNKPRIIAAGVVGPQESTLQYYHVDRTNATMIEVFDVEADYYLKAPFFSRPDASKYTRNYETEVMFEQLSQEKIAAILNDATVANTH